jgi:predicted nuclease of predicted toxin-antitoxin system
MGFDVVTTSEIGNKGSTDEEQLEYARKNKRAVCTSNGAIDPIQSYLGSVAISLVMTDSLVMEFHLLSLQH